MNGLQIFNNDVNYMSSVEIAELTGKRHDNVMTDINNIFCELDVLKNQDISDALNFEPISYKGTYKDSMNRSQDLWMLNKNDTLLLVSGYSVILRKKIIDRWDELERNKPQVPTTYLGALEKLVAEVRAKEQLQLELSTAVEVIQEKEEVIEELESHLSFVFNRHQFDDVLSSSALSTILKETFYNIDESINFVPSNQDVNKILCSMNLIGVRSGAPNPGSVLQRFYEKYPGVPDFGDFQTSYEPVVKFNRNSELFARFVLDVKNYGIKHQIGVKKNRLRGMKI